MLEPRRNFLRRNRRPTFSNLLDEFLSPSFRSFPQQNTPSVFDVIQKIDEENNTAVTHMFVPGITEDQVDVSVNSSASIINVVVNVEGSENNDVVQQVYTDRFQRSFRMTSDYDVEQTTVALTNGVLTLITPRIEKSPQSIKLPINTDKKKK